MLGRKRTYHEDIISTVSDLRARGIEFLSHPPEEYYKAVPLRLAAHNHELREDIETLKSLGIMIDADEETAKIDKKITDLTGIVNKIDQKLDNKKFIERAPGDIINQNISNKAKIENDILSLRSLRDTLSN